MSPLIPAERAAGSDLALWFSEYDSMKKDKDGYVFIDRDGERFRVILNWLQTGQIKLTDIAEAECILSDATFFNVCSFSFCCC